jgi:hypothetical protein
MVFLLFVSKIVSGQIVLHTSKDTSSQQKTGIKVSVLNPNGKNAMEYSGHVMHSDSVPYGIKLNPANFSRGEFLLYYEQRISDAFSVEGAGGVTYIDYMYELFNNGGNYLSFGQSPGPPVKFYSGVSGKIQLRWYPSRYETAITGYYFAPEFSYKNYKMDYYVFTGLISEPHRMERKWTDIKLQFGYQTADPYEKIFFDWYISIGARKHDEVYMKGRGYDAEFIHTKYWNPIIGAGVKIGFTL